MKIVGKMIVLTENLQRFVLVLREGEETEVGDVRGSEVKEDALTVEDPHNRAARRDPVTFDLFVRYILKCKIDELVICYEILEKH